VYGYIYSNAPNSYLTNFEQINLSTFAVSTYTSPPFNTILLNVLPTWNLQIRVSSQSDMSTFYVFLLFSSQIINFCDYPTTVIQAIVNLSSPTQSIAETFFSSTADTMVFTLFSNLYSNYTLGYLNTTTTASSATTLPVPSTSNFIRTVQDSGYIYLMFDVGICIYSENTSLLLINYINFAGSPSPSSVFSMDVYQSMLVYSIGPMITVL
jgi:hypothetical protein